MVFAKLLTNFFKLKTRPHSFIHSSVVQPPIHLCVLTQFFPPDYAPTGQLIDELTQQLGKQGIKVEVFTGQPGYAFRSTSAPNLELRNEIRVRRSRTTQIWPQRIRGKAANGVLFCLRAGLHLLKAWKYHNIVLLTTAPPFLPILGYLAHLLFKLPYVCLIYDLYPDIAIELGVISSSQWVAKIWRALNHRVWREAQGIIVLSDSMRHRITQACPEVADKVTVIHSWADPQLIKPMPKACNWFAWKHHLVKPFTVLYSGNMGRCHDMRTILEMIQLLQTEPIQFVFIGGGPQRQAFIDQVRQRGLHHCLFLPYQDKEVLPYSLTACDLSLVSVSEGMEDLVAPSKLYSALCTGRPIAAICPPNSYLTTLIDNAHCGVAFKNGASSELAAFIRFLCKESQQAQQMGDAGRRYLETHFSPETIARQYAAVLQEAVEKSRPTFTQMRSALRERSVPIHAPR